MLPPDPLRGQEARQKQVVIGHRGRSVKKMSAKEHYTTLYAELIERHGALNDETISSIIGFSGGGPVSMCQIGHEAIYVTCELSLYPDQICSTDGFRYELLSLGGIDEDACRAIFTALGDLSMEAQLGDTHTVDVSGIAGADGITAISLKKFSSSRIGDGMFGIYEVIPKRLSCL